MIKKIYLVLTFIFLFFGFASLFSVSAADFRTSYDIEYFIKDNDPQNFTKTTYAITLTNLRPDLIIKKFTLIFPKSFSIGNIVARDYKGSITPVINQKNRSIETTFEFHDPN